MPMKHNIKDEVIDSLLNDYKKPEDLFGQNGLMNELKKRLIERVMAGELRDHLGYAKNTRGAAKEKKNSRNGSSSKTIKSDDLAIEIAVPRDRNGDFEPQLIPKHERRFDGFDAVILSLYARGLTVRDIQEHLKELYNVEVSHTLISSVTSEVVDELKTWQNRPLENVYPIVFFDAISVKIRHEGKVSNRSIYLALAIRLDGQKEVLGMWSSQNEGSKFWLGILTELRNRGVNDLFICCIDGLTGFCQAIETVFPQAKVQLCIVHLVRNSLKFVGWKERKQVAAQLKNIYRASTAEAAKEALDAFARDHQQRFPAIAQIWYRHWDNIIPFFDYPDEIRKVIYTTNAIESLNSSFRKISRNRNLFSTEESLFKLFFLAMKNISKKWTMPVANWPQALNRFSIEFSDRMPTL
jgi:putative transposase